MIPLTVLGLLALAALGAVVALLLNPMFWIGAIVGGAVVLTGRAIRRRR